MTKNKSKKEDVKDDIIMQVKKTEKKVIKLCPHHWARQEGIDEKLFEYWKNELMTEEEYTKIKNKVYRKK